MHGPAMAPQRWVWSPRLLLAAAALCTASWLRVMLQLAQQEAVLLRIVMLLVVVVAVVGSMGWLRRIV